MKKVGEYVIYRKEVCKIVEIKENFFKNQDYYRLIPISDKTLHLDVPINNPNNLLRDLITKTEVKELRKKIPSIKPIESQEKTLEDEYKDLINTGYLENYIKIIKTAYLRNQARLENKKKISDKDNYYFNLAEKYLYNEFGKVLDKDFEETKNYVIEEVLKQK